MEYIPAPKHTLTEVEHLIENGDNEGLQELQKHQKRYLQQEANKARNRSDRVLEKDDLAMCLLPSDIPQPGYTLYPAKTTGNRDCLFNAVSISLNGDEALSNIIRASTAVELFLNADSYAQHKQIDIAVSHPDTSLTADSFRCLILTDKANKVYNECKNFRKAIQIEARETCKAGNWSSFVHVMVISSLLNRNVWSVYPESNKGIRPLFHSKITQPMANCTDDIFIMWSRDGNLDNREGYAFEPNHFVPLMQMQESETTDFNDSDDEVLLSLSAEMLEIAKMEGLKNELSTETEDLHGVIEEVKSLEKEVAEQDKSTEKEVVKLDKMAEKEVAEQDKMTGAEVAEQDDSKGEEVTELDISIEVKETKQDKSTERDNGKEILSKEKGACVLSEQKSRKGNVKQRKTFEEPGHDNLKEYEMKQNKSKEKQNQENAHIKQGNSKTDDSLKNEKSMDDKPKGDEIDRQTAMKRKTLHVLRKLSGRQKMKRTCISCKHDTSRMIKKKYFHMKKCRQTHDDSDFYTTSDELPLSELKKTFDIKRRKCGI